MMPGPRLRACPHCELRKVGYHRSMSTSCAVLILHLCLLAQLRSTWGSHDDPATLYLATKPEQPSMLLLSAMGNQTINRIVLTSDYTMARSPEMPDTPAVLVSRNVTIEGAPGLMPVLDLGFAAGLVQLCSTCVLTLQNLVLEKCRRGSGPAIDLFRGQPGSVVQVVNVMLIKLACVPSSAALKTINSTQRSTHGVLASGQQLVHLVNATYQGNLYPDTLFYQDVTTDVPPMVVEGQGFIGGYSLSCRNGTFLCLSRIGYDCIKRKGSDRCINNAIDNAIDNGTTNPVSAAPAMPRRTAIAAAVVVPTVTTIVLLVVAAVLWVRGHRRKKALQQALQAKAGSEPGGAAGSNAESGTQMSNRDVPAPGVPASSKRGWQVVNSLTSPLLGPVEDSTIEFGEQLGKGSFGQVHKARWNNRDVAVKVIEHSASSVKAVEQELALMFSFNHKNILRGFHYITYVSSCCSIAEDSEHSSSKAGAARPNSGQQKQQQQQRSSCNGSGTSPQDTPELVADAPAHDIGGKQLITAADNHHQHHLQQQEQQPGWYGSNRSDGSAYSTRIRSTHCSAQRAETHLVLELCDCTLSEYMRHLQPVPLSEEVLLQLLALLQDVAQGLAVLHAVNVVHADLNGRNVLVTADNSSPYGVAAKVADLGLARLIDEQRTHRTTDTIGTLSHMAPEVLRSGKISVASDIYAYGILMYELYTGQAAFRKLQYWQFFETVALHGLRPLIPHGMPADYQMLMEHCWQADPSNRPNASRVLECLHFMVEERKVGANPAAMLLRTSVSVPASVLLAKIRKLQDGHDPEGNAAEATAAAAGAAAEGSATADVQLPLSAGRRPAGYAGYDYAPHNRESSATSDRPFDSAGSGSHPRKPLFLFYHQRQQQQLQQGGMQHAISIPSGLQAPPAAATAAAAEPERRRPSIASSKMSSIRDQSWIKSFQEFSMLKSREHSSKSSFREGSSNRVWDHIWFV